MFTFADRYPLTTAPYEFVVKTWNLDDFYPHTPTFMVMVEPALPEEELRRLHDALLALGLLRGT